MDNKELIEKLERISKNRDLIIEYTRSAQALDAKYDTEIGQLEKDHIKRLADDINSLKASIGLCFPAMPFDSSISPEEILRKAIISGNFNTPSKEFRAEIKNFDEKYASFAAQYDMTLNSATKSLKEKKNSLNKQRASKIKEYLNKIDDLNSEIIGFDILHKDYYYLAGDIAKILSTRRATDLTSALNMAIKEASGK